MALLDLGPIVFGSKRATLDFLMGKNVLAKEKKCVCGTEMEISPRSDVSDGYRWRCPDCKKCVSVRKGSFFEKSKISLRQWILLLHWWARQYPVTDAGPDVGVTEPTAIQVYSYFRDVCSHRLCNIDPPIKLGGPGTVVAIDESLFTHKPKVNNTFHKVSNIATTK